MNVEHGGIGELAFIWTALKSIQMALRRNSNVENAVNTARVDRQSLLQFRAAL